MQQSDLGLNLSTKKTRKREFLEQMQQLVPLEGLGRPDHPLAPEGRKGRPPFPVEMLLRIHFMQQWFTLNDPAMQETLHDMPLFRDFWICSNRSQPGKSNSSRSSPVSGPRSSPPFRVIKRLFGHVKTRYRGLKKNIQQLQTLFALANLWMARGRLLGSTALKAVVKV